MYWPLRRGSGSASVSHRQRTAAPRACLEGVVAGEATKDGACDDLEVEEDRPMLDVVEVILDTLLDLFHGVSLAAPSVYLSPAGDSRLHPVASVVVLDGVLIEQCPSLGGERMRPRADN